LDVNEEDLFTTKDFKMLLFFFFRMG